MTEQKDWLSAQVERQRENAEKRQAWDQEQAARKERQRRNAAQAQLEGYLRRRGQAWQHATGSAPSSEVLERWQREYLDSEEAEYQRERAEKLRDADPFG